jgi:hypothetical protein
MTAYMGGMTAMPQCSASSWSEGVDPGLVLVGPVLQAKPDRPLPVQVADHDPMGVALADRELVDADAARTRCASARQLRPHVLLVQFLDRVPVQMQPGSDILDRGTATPSADVVGKPLGMERVVGQKLQTLALHGPALPAVHAPDFQLQVGPIKISQHTRNNPVIS